MPAVRVTITTTEFLAATFSWYEIFASQTNLALGAVVATAEYSDLGFAKSFIHPNLNAGETWYYWVRAAYDRGDAYSSLRALGSVDVDDPSASGGGGSVSDEHIRDVVVAMLQPGANVTLTEDDPGDTLEIDVSIPSDSGGGSGGMPFPGYIAGRKYGPVFNNNTARTVAADHIYAVPFRVFEDVTFTTASLFLIDGVAAKSLRVMIFDNVAAAGRGFPGALIQTLGTSAAAVANEGQIDFTGLSVPLTAGIYWLALQSDGAINVKATGQDEQVFGEMMGFYNVIGNSWFGYDEAAAYASGAPDPFPGSPPTPYNGGLAMPMLYLSF